MFGFRCPSTMRMPKTAHHRQLIEWVLVGIGFPEMNDLGPEHFCLAFLQQVGSFVVLFQKCHVTEQSLIGVVQLASTHSSVMQVQDCHNPTCAQPTPSFQDSMEIRKGPLDAERRLLFGANKMESTKTDCFSSCTLLRLLNFSFVCQRFTQNLACFGQRFQVAERKPTILRGPNT